MSGLYFINSEGERFEDNDAIRCKKEGQGTMVWDNGTKKYVGDFKNGQSHGEGNCVWTGLFEYNGSFRNGVPDGIGTMEYMGGGEPGGVWHNGGKYEGEWKKKKKHGNGVYSDKLGNRFEGNWYNGQGLVGKYTLINGKTYSSKFDINVFLNFNTGNAGNEQEASNGEVMSVSEI